MSLQSLSLRKNPRLEEPKKEEYVNISNPEDNEIYDAPKKPSTPQEQMQMAIDSIEKRSKYLDEPNVISDEAVDNIENSISFFDDEDLAKILSPSPTLKKNTKSCKTFSVSERWFKLSDIIQGQPRLPLFIFYF